MYLAPDNILNISFKGKNFCIKQKIIDDNQIATKQICSYIKEGNFVKPRQLISFDGIPKGITVHNTPEIPCSAQTNQAEQYSRATYNGNMNGVVVHYYVYQDEIWQLLKDNEQGWHASDGESRRTGHTGTQIGGNIDTIAIECIGSKEHTEDTTALLIAYLLSEYNLSYSDIYTHNFWMYGKDEIISNVPKNCPLYILSHWSSFINKIKSITNQEVKYMYRVEISVSDKDTAQSIAKSIKSKGYSALILTDLITQSTVESKPASNLSSLPISKGAQVMVKSGAKSYEGVTIASFVYSNVYTVDQLNGDRAVLDLKGLCTAFKISDLNVVASV